MPFIQSNGIHIYYEVQGAGEPLVLIAGLGYGLWQWHKVVPGLAQHFQVVTFDNRGAGQTDKPAGAYTAQMLAADTAGLIDGLGIAPAVVLGHSMGGFVAQELALSYPHLVKTLVLASTNFGGPNHIPVTPEAMAILMDTTLSPEERVRKGVQVACAEGFAIKHPDVMEELVAYRMSAPVPPAAYQSQMAVGLGLLAYESCFEPRLPALQMPVIIISGSEDQTVPPGNVDLLAKVIPNARTHIMQNTSHLFMIEAPERTVAALVELLKS